MAILDIDHLTLSQMPGISIYAFFVGPLNFQLSVTLVMNSCMFHGNREDVGRASLPLFFANFSWHVHGIRPCHSKDGQVLTIRSVGWCQGVSNTGSCISIPHNCTCDFADQITDFMGFSWRFIPIWRQQQFAFFHHHSINVFYVKGLFSTPQSNKT